MTPLQKGQISQISTRKWGKVVKNDIKLPSTGHENTENTPKVGKKFTHFPEPSNCSGVNNRFPFYSCNEEIEMIIDFNSIREAKVEKDTNGNISRVTIIFGPHYYINIELNENGVLTFNMGTTHHGFTSPANEVGKGLEEIIWVCFI